MTCGRVLLAALLAAALATGCATHEETSYATKTTLTATDTGSRTTTTVVAPEHIRKHDITLATGDALTVRVDPEDDHEGEVKAVIASGHSNAGTYRSIVPGLFETAADAQRAWANGAPVGIHVDDKDEIVGIWWEDAR